MSRMTRRLMAGFAMHLGVAALFCANGTAAFGSGEPQESFLYQNFVRASEVLDRAVTAHGGPELLDRARDIRVSLTGTYHYEGHGDRPWAYRDYKLKGDWIYSAALGAVRSEAMLEYDKPQLSFAIVGPANGIEVDAGDTKPDSIPAAKLGERLREEFEFLPQEFLRQARDRAASLRLLSGAKGYDVVHYSLENGEGRALFFDSKSHLLMRVERIDHWEIKGDRLEWRTFAAYADHDWIRVPMHSEAHKEGFSTQNNVITEIAKIEFDAPVKAEEFTIPAASRAGFEEWALQSPAAKPDELLPFHDLGKSVYIIDMPPSDSRALLVGFTDYSVVVEAGDRSDLGDRLLRTAAKVMPDKPVRYVAMTHHHPLYANTIRPYVQRGVKVLVTEGNVSYMRDLATRPYRIHPDEEQRHPREPVFEVIKGKRIIEDGGQRLEFHQFDYSTHTLEYVLPYLASHKLIVTGDMVYILRGAEPGPASSRERALQRVITERGLDVETIMQTWFLQTADQLTPYSLLEEKIRLAEAKDAKK